MIGFLSGQLLHKAKEGTNCVVNVSGVGYEVTVPRPIFEILAVGEACALWTHTHVREDALILFGFPTESERAFFRLLTSVSGLGPKHGLSLLAEASPQNLSHFILTKDVASLTKAAGVGKKLAERLVLELGSKLEKLVLFDPDAKKKSSDSAPVSKEAEIVGDLKSALTNLGYQTSEINAAINGLISDSTPVDFEVVFRQALQILSKKSATISRSEVGGHA